MSAQPGRDAKQLSAKTLLIMYQSQRRQNRIVISTVVRSTKWRNIDIND